MAFNDRNDQEVNLRDLTVVDPETYREPDWENCTPLREEDGVGECPSGSVEWRINNWSALPSEHATYDDSTQRGRTYSEKETGATTHGTCHQCTS